MSEVNITPLGSFLLGQQLRRNLAAVREQWETLFEGTVTTAESSNYSGAVGTVSGDTALFGIGGDTIRLTVNGSPATFTVTGSKFGLAVGNQYLLSSPDSSLITPDTGYDYCVNSLFSFVSSTTFMSRNPGTYNIKIERMMS